MCTSSVGDGATEGLAETDADADGDGADSASPPPHPATNTITAAEAAPTPSRLMRRIIPAPTRPREHKSTHQA